MGIHSDYKVSTIVRLLLLLFSFFSFFSCITLSRITRAFNNKSKSSSFVHEVDDTTRAGRSERNSVFPVFDSVVNAVELIVEVSEEAGDEESSCPKLYRVKS